MRFIIAAVGKPRHRGLAAAIQDYESRAARYWPLEVREVREEHGGTRGIGGETVSAREGDRLLSGVPPAAHVVACHPDGDALSSEEFSAWMLRQRERAAADVAFLIGGAFGLSALVRERASTHLSFSRWTLPHELARLVLAEQIYRAGTIARGEPYHK
ncbi:MAG: 23S rRNA (pseudouridine(1915)-N(3))-methyltransferase RlmH [Gemmatimonadaceae bacterium]